MTETPEEHTAPSTEAVFEAEWPKRLDGQQDFHPKLVLYGSPGAGKTMLAATAPRPFFMSCDPEGLIGISDSGHLWWDIKDIDDMRACWTWLAANPTEYDTIVVDTLTNLQILGMDEIVEPEILTLGKNIWGKSFRQMRSVIVGLCAFTHHNVVFVCTDKLRDDEITSLKILQPDVPPSQFKLLNLNCRLMMHLGVYRQQDPETKETVPHRWLQTYNDGRKVCKDTSGRLPQMIFVEHPDRAGEVDLMTWIIDTLRGADSKEASME